MATGRSARTLGELRDRIASVRSDSLTYHFWGGLLRPRFDDPEYPNDFASWAHHALHDEVLAERLAIIDPTAFDDLEQLRQELIEIVDERLDEMESVSWCRSSDKFVFLRSQIVVFDTNRRLHRPSDLIAASQDWTLGTVFYHVIDAQRRLDEGTDDLRPWLKGFGDEHTDLIDALAELDPFFTSLADLRSRLVQLFQTHLDGGGA